MMLPVRNLRLKIVNYSIIFLFITIFYFSTKNQSYCFSIKEDCSKIFSNKLVSKAIPQLFLLGTVGGGFYLTSQITKVIPDEYSYLSNIVTFASGMAVVAVGAPIFRKFMPIIDKQAFKISLMPQSQPMKEVPSQSLGQVWESMNAHFDVNSQMAINQVLKVQDLISSTVTRILSFKGSPSDRQKYALYQFVWLASIYHKFFYYISPNDQTTAYSVSMMASTILGLNFSKLKEDCLQLLTKLYPDDTSYYQTLLASWFDELIKNSLLQCIPDTPDTSTIPSPLH